MIFRTWIFLCILPTAHAAGFDSGTSVDLETMFQKMEDDTKLFAKQMEEFLLPENKCSQETIQSCSEANYNACNSELPGPTCPGYDYVIPACGSGQDGGCSGLYDFTSSIVSLAPDKAKRFDLELLPSPAEADAICSSFPADEYMMRSYDDAKSYWTNKYEVLPPQMYYGNDDGVFRMYPGTPEECPYGQSEYDPRIRPWYVAASTGPKDIILVLDTSASMSTADRINIMKEAAKRVINTLGISDYFSVVEFNSYANQIGMRGEVGVLQRATDENKNNMLRAIDDLSPNGGTDFQKGFKMAYDIFDASENAESASGCHQAILFLTDGMGGSDSLFDLLDDQVVKYDEKSKPPPVIFTYTFGNGVDSSVPQKIACDYKGIWSAVEDGGDLAKSMGAYYKYFAYAGLSEDDFVAWVAPYKYSTTGELGTTASAPVYDRSVDPPILAGVVGLDFSFAAMERALGREGEESKNAIIDKIVKRSVAVCPSMKFQDDCQLESLRVYGSGTGRKNLEAQCNDSCTAQSLNSPLCTDTKYPEFIWNNNLNEGRSYEEKVCCTVGEEPRIANSMTYDEIKGLVCVESGSNVGLVIGLSVAGGIVAIGLASYIQFRIKKKRESISGIPKTIIPPPPTAPSSN